MNNTFIDSHAHLDLPEFDADRTEVIARAAAAGVTRIITVGIDITSSRQAIALAEQHNGIYATAGVHPGSAASARPEDIDTLTQLAGHPRVVAIGETGLDYYRMRSPKETQVKWLMHQLELSHNTGLPVSLHSRLAEPDLGDIVSRWATSHPVEGKLRGVVHCFGGDAATAARYSDIGFCISFAAYIGYPSARSMADVVRSVPDDRLLIETDCPFLPPPGRRGQRNEPSYIVQTAEVLAEFRGVPVEEIARQTRQNAERLFGLG